MKRIESVIDHELTWTQPSAFKNTYELRFGGELVGTLLFPKMMSTMAIAESGDGKWTIEKIGLWKSKIVVRPDGSESELGSFRNNAWKAGGILELPSGRTYQVTRRIWKGILEFRNEYGEVLFELQNRGVFRFSALVRFNRAVSRVAELPWIVYLAFYIAIMARRDAATHAAAG